MRSLTKEYIRQALEACLEDDGYALKFYFIAQHGCFDIQKMNIILDEIKKEQAEWDRSE
ncbi:ferritin-like protein [Paenibacillus popilliae ATCC 14706]|uniref:Ferritin-like protein n=1 Tax=Paenibacillus popilliae ATCC 14706 TaxID=1212764 RepID=M9M7W5_PAEPP|nr:ferritin-like protein [Paenibacillus popilliae ATCC 14706]